LNSRCKKGKGEPRSKQVGTENSYTTGGEKERERGEGFTSIGGKKKVLNE